jgi:hypothetical protein
MHRGRRSRRHQRRPTTHHRSRRASASRTTSRGPVDLGRFVRHPFALPYKHFEPLAGEPYDSSSEPTQCTRGRRRRPEVLPDDRHTPAVVRVRR